ncbi:MAG: hypothetical protein U0599_09495 [Vicinamibacteria bacterium]
MLKGLEEPKAELSTPQTLLPEFYYDLMARILPGVVFAATLLFLLGAFEVKAAIERVAQTAWAPIVFLVTGVGTCGYIIGILLTPLQARVRSGYIPEVWQPILASNRAVICEKQAQLGLRDFAAELDNAIRGSVWRPADRAALARVARQLYSPLHDLLKARLPQAQLVLPKMNGETGLCDNICAGLTVLSLVPVSQMLHAARFDEKLAWYSVVLLFLALISFWAAKVRYDGLVRRHFAFWNLVPQDVQPGGSPPASASSRPEGGVLSEAAAGEPVGAP